MSNVSVTYSLTIIAVLNNKWKNYNTRLLNLCDDIHPSKTERNKRITIYIYILIIIRERERDRLIHTRAFVKPVVVH